jgi:hypothetical protein
MATLSVDDSYLSYVEIPTDGEGVCISFPIGNDGLAIYLEFQGPRKTIVFLIFSTG